MRMTRQRRRILERLRTTTKHPTAAELYAQLRREMPRISLGTVYRNLQVLVREKEALRLDNGEGPARYDGNANPHHHSTCVVCSSVCDVNVPDVPAVKAYVPGMRAYRFLGHRLEFHGVCPVCQKTGAEGVRP